MAVWKPIGRTPFGERAKEHRADMARLECGNDELEDMVDEVSEERGDVIEAR